MKLLVEDTIAAIATAPGEAGIGIVRISGPDSIYIAEKIFKSKVSKELKDYPQRRLIYGYIINPYDGKKIDEVLISYMKAPYTYTTEDVVEINCHGGMIAVKRILEIVLKNGARLADRGEFTKRAFLNGRIDLSQAEAVMNMISAKTDKGFDISLNQLEGGLSKEVNSVQDILIEMMAHIEASIDFPEDDVENVLYEKIMEKANIVLKRIRKMIDTSDAGRIIQDGLKTVILGKPNVGKSSLMNAMLRENRAIVTDIPGTTRDIIEEYININGIPLKIIDTAGIRSTEDLVEKMGVERAKENLNMADLVIAVFDVSQKLTDEDREIIKLIKNKKAIVILNKTDLPEVIKEKELKEHLSDKVVINTSILKGNGIDKLEDTIKDMFFSGDIKVEDEIIINNIRHKDLLVKAEKDISEAIESIELNMPLDCIEVDIKSCWENLGMINGETVTEDIIDRIFQDFCIGK